MISWKGNTDFLPEQITFDSVIQNFGLGVLLSMHNLSATIEPITIRSPQRDRPRAVTITEKTPLETEFETAERKLSEGPTD